MWGRRGLVPVQWVRVVPRGPAESLYQHAHQDKTGTPGLEHSGRGTVSQPPPPPPPDTRAPAFPCPSPPLTGPQSPPSSPAYLNIGLLTSPALQNSKGNVEPRNGKKPQQQKKLNYVKYCPKNLGLWWKQQLMNTTVAYINYFTTTTGWSWSLSSKSKRHPEPLEGLPHPWTLVHPHPPNPTAFYSSVSSSSVSEAHVSSDWWQSCPAVGHGRFGRQDMLKDDRKKT